MVKIASIFLVIPLLVVSLSPTSGEEPLPQLVKTGPTQEEFVRERLRSISVFSDANRRKDMHSYFAKIKEKAENIMEAIDSYNSRVNLNRNMFLKVKN